MSVDLTRVVSKDPFDSAGIPREHCEECGGVGWIIALLTGNVERCDTCELYESDSDAALACVEEIYIRSKGEYHLEVRAELLREQEDSCSSWRFYVRSKLNTLTMPHRTYYNVQHVIRDFFPEVYLLH